VYGARQWKKWMEKKKEKRGEEEEYKKGQITSR
jgi:hypothetical protein